MLWRVFAEIQFQESDESPIGFCHKDDGGVGWLLEVLPRLRVMVRERSWPQGLAQTNPVGPIGFNNLSDLHPMLLGPLGPQSKSRQRKPRPPTEYCPAQVRLLEGIRKGWSQRLSGMAA